MEPELGAVSCIPSINQNGTLRRFEKAADQVHQCGFSGPRFSYNRHIGSLRHLQIKMLQNILFSIRIAEGNIPELYISVQGLPVFLLRMEGVPVTLCDLTPVCHIRLCMKKPRQSLNVYLNGNKRRNGLNDILDRIHHIQRVGKKYRQCSDLKDTLHRDTAALPEDKRQCRRAHKGHKRGKQCRIMGRLHGRLAHFFRILLKILPDTVLNHKRLDRSCPRDALVKIARNG